MMELVQENEMNLKEVLASLAEPQYKLANGKVLTKSQLAKELGDSYSEEAVAKLIKTGFIEEIGTLEEEVLSVNGSEPEQEWFEGKTITIDCKDEYQMDSLANRLSKEGFVYGSNKDTLKIFVMNCNSNDAKKINSIIKFNATSEKIQGSLNNAVDKATGATSFAVNEVAKPVVTVATHGVVKICADTVGTLAKTGLKIFNDTKKTGKQMMADIKSDPEAKKLFSGSNNMSAQMKIS